LKDTTEYPGNLLLSADWFLKSTGAGSPIVS